MSRKSSSPAYFSRTLSQDLLVPDLSTGNTYIYICVDEKKQSMRRTVQAKGEGTQPARMNHKPERRMFICLYISRIIPPYMNHESSMSSKKNTEIIMKASLQNKRDGLPPTGAPVDLHVDLHVGLQHVPSLPCT